jgi:hypothetical protein
MDRCGCDVEQDEVGDPIVNKAIDGVTGGPPDD